MNLQKGVGRTALWLYDMLKRGHMFSPELTNESFLGLGDPGQTLADLMVSLLLFSIFITFLKSTTVRLF